MNLKYDDLKKIKVKIRSHLWIRLLCFFMHVWKFNNNLS